MRPVLRASSQPLEGVSAVTSGTISGTILGINDKLDNLGFDGSHNDTSLQRVSHLQPQTICIAVDSWLVFDAH